MICDKCGKSIEDLHLSDVVIIFNYMDYEGIAGFYYHYHCVINLTIKELGIDK